MPLGKSLFGKRDKSRDTRHPSTIAPTDSGYATSENHSSDTTATTSNLTNHSNHEPSHLNRDHSVLNNRDHTGLGSDRSHSRGRELELDQPTGNVIDRDTGNVVTTVTTTTTTTTTTTAGANGERVVKTEPANETKQHEFDELNHGRNSALTNSTGSQLNRNSTHMSDGIYSNPTRDSNMTDMGSNNTRSANFTDSTIGHNNQTDSHIGNTNRYSGNLTESTVGHNHHNEPYTGNSTAYGGNTTESTVGHTTGTEPHIGNNNNRYSGNLTDSTPGHNNRNEPHMGDSTAYGENTTDSPLGHINRNDSNMTSATVNPGYDNTSHSHSNPISPIVRNSDSPPVPSRNAMRDSSRNVDVAPSATGGMNMTPPTSPTRHNFSYPTRTPLNAIPSYQAANEKIPVENGPVRTTNQPLGTLANLKAAAAGLHVSSSFQK